MEAKFKQWDCIVQGGMYSSGNNRKAILLVDKEDGQMIAYATTNLPDEPLDDTEVFIKDYSENEGMVQCLVDAGVIFPGPIKFAQSGYVFIRSFRLTPKAINTLWVDALAETNK